MSLLNAVAMTFRILHEPPFCIARNSIFHMNSLTLLDVLLTWFSFCVCESVASTLSFVSLTEESCIFFSLETFVNTVLSERNIMSYTSNSYFLNLNTTAFLLNGSHTEQNLMAYVVLTFPQFTSNLTFLTHSS